MAGTRRASPTPHCQGCGHFFDGRVTARPGRGGIIGHYDATGERFAFCDRCLVPEEYTRHCGEWAPTAETLRATWRVLQGGADE
jgi:hypothetical protein